MSNDTTSRILGNPAYRHLIHQRDSLAWWLSVCVLVIYFGFVLMVAFLPQVLTAKIAEGSVIPLGIPIGVGVIVCSIILTGVYVRRANHTYDPMIEAIIKDASK